MLSQKQAYTVGVVVSALPLKHHPQEAGGNC